MTLCVSQVTIQVSGYGRGIPVSAEGMAEFERFQQATAKRRWKARHRMERVSRRIWAPRQSFSLEAK